jgi:hypothetical protein
LQLLEAKPVLPTLMQSSAAVKARLIEKPVKWPYGLFSIKIQVKTFNKNKPILNVLVDDMPKNLIRKVKMLKCKEQIL